MIDPAVVLEKIVVNTSDAPLRPSYLGPPESAGPTSGRASVAPSGILDR